MAYPVSRRDFVFMASAGMVCPAVLGADGRPRLKEVVGSAEIGKELTPWKYGELDLHFVHTGHGENMFYRFPDGTTMVNDTGDFYRPKEIKNIPWHPNGKLLGGHIASPHHFLQVIELLCKLWVLLHLCLQVLLWIVAHFHHLGNHLYEIVVLHSVTPSYFSTP
jgi:hypothetical protein